MVLIYKKRVQAVIYFLIVLYITKTVNGQNQLFNLYSKLLFATRIAEAMLFEKYVSFSVKRLFSLQLHFFYK